MYRWRKENQDYEKKLVSFGYCLALQFEASAVHIIVFCYQLSH